MSTLIWLGPVVDFQVRASVPPGFTLHVVQCVGDVQAGLMRCANVADRLLDQDGRRLPTALRELGIADDEDVYGAAFSAGGSWWRRVLLHPLDRARIKGLFMFDATYGESDGKGGVKLDALQLALVDMAVECIADGRPFVATAGSSPASKGKAPSASMVLTALRHAIELATEHRFADVTAAFDLDELPAAPVAGWQCARVVFLDFGDRVGHDPKSNHAIDVAPTLLPRMVAG